MSWWLVGFSLIAANISTEQFVGMSGAAANWLGMAIASYEWMAAITLVFVAFWFLPKFLKAGLYTIPEFLEYRFDTVARMTMSIYAMLTLVFVTTSSVIFSGAKFVSEYYHDVPVISSLPVMCILIAAFAAVYVFVGGLKACAWTDLIWGSGLILGGVIVMVLAFSHLADAPAVSARTAKAPRPCLKGRRQGLSCGQGLRHECHTRFHRRSTHASSHPVKHPVAGFGSNSFVGFDRVGHAEVMMSKGRLDFRGLQCDIITKPLHNAMKTLQVRVTDDLRSNADAVLEDIGLDMPTAIRLYLNKIVQTRSIPFSLEAGGVVIEEMEVDAATQKKMDAIGNAWRNAKR